MFSEKDLPPIEPQKKMAQHSLALTVFLSASAGTGKTFAIVVRWSQYRNL
jgi:ATP-dependent exoDNAse (exonuclease V) beta subunit